MKQHLKKIISTPKLAIGIAGILALSVGIVSVVSHKNTLSRRTAEIDALSSSTTQSTSQDLTLAFATGGRIKNVSVKIGDMVKAGTVLASLDAENAIGAINQARAAYLVAQTNYDKLVNGAFTPDIAVSQASVDSASVALSNAKQNLQNELTSAYNNVKTAVLIGTNNSFNNPQSLSPQFFISDTVQTNPDLVNKVNNERQMINSDLALWQEEISSISDNTVNKVVDDSLNYSAIVRAYFVDFISLLTNYTQVTRDSSRATLNAYQLSAASQKSAVDATYDSINLYAQAVKNAQFALAQAKAALALKQAPARFEDLEIAKAQVQSMEGALQIAQSAYNNTIIVAPIDGKITNVSITAGQIAIPNIAAIELVSQ